MNLTHIGYAALFGVASYYVYNNLLSPENQTRVKTAASYAKTTASYALPLGFVFHNFYKRQFGLLDATISLDLGSAACSKFLSPNNQSKLKTAVYWLKIFGIPLYNLYNRQFGFYESIVYTALQMKCLAGLRFSSSEIRDNIITGALICAEAALRFFGQNPLDHRMDRNEFEKAKTEILNKLAENKENLRNCLKYYPGKNPLSPTSPITRCEEIRQKSHELWIALADLTAGFYWNRGM